MRKCNTDSDLYRALPTPAPPDPTKFCEKGAVDSVFFTLKSLIQYGKIAKS